MVEEGRLEGLGGFEMELVQLPGMLLQVKVATESFAANLGGRGRLWFSNC